jgi:hypothetical protein
MEGCVSGIRRRRLMFTMVIAVLTVLAGIPASTAFAGQLAGSAAAGASSGCPAATVGQVTCGALITPGIAPVGALAAGTAPAGLAPSALQDAYGFQSSTAGTRQTVAVVTAYDDATAEKDMGTYRSQYSIPACTTADGCFSKVNQTGGTSYPPAVAGWSAATAQSLDMISAVCPNCHIVLVEATTTAITDLGQAENEAVGVGARFVTNTWFTPEATFGTSEPGYDSSYFNHPGVAITAPDGNNGGYGTYYPAASPDVIAVGGTTLTASSTVPRGWTETAWSGSGAGCSPYEAKPSWQADTGCSTRVLNDVSAVADPSPTGSPIAFYDTGTGTGGWQTGGGNGAAASIVAAAYALAGSPPAGSSPASYLYAHTGNLINDITTGSDGTCSPAPAYFCAAGTGYDGPTGVGTLASAIPLSSTGTSRTGVITSGIAGKCVDNYLGGTANYNKIDIYSCNGSVPQLWTAEADGTIRIQGKCLDNRGNVNANKNTVDLYDCIGSPAQQWRVRYPNALENPSTGKCLDDPNGTTTDTTQLEIYTCNQSAAQQWALPYPTPTSTGEITSGVPAPGATTPGGECLDNLRGFSTDSNKVDIWSCNGGAGSQLWTVEADSTIRIAGKCLDNRGDGTANHNPVELYTCNSHDSQQWLARSDGSLLNPETGKCLDDTNGATTNGIQIGIYTCIESAGQKWALPS